MLKLIFKSILLSLFCSILFGCENNDFGDNDNDINANIGIGSVHGVVTDYATGEPIANANVTLNPLGETTLTGYDGLFQFYDIKEGDYSITVSKAEYTDLIDDYVIKVRDGLNLRRDVQIKKVPTYIRLTDMMGNDISNLDFGTDPFTNILSFNIYNNGTVKINCNVTYSCEWITTVTPKTCSISQGDNAMVSIKIDRSKLKAGVNSTFLYVSSNNGSNMLEISVIGEEILPSVVTLPVTDTQGKESPLANVFHARVTVEGNPSYIKRGFCYSESNSMPTINSNRIDVSGTGIGEYSYTCWDFWDIPYAQKYYVRAWVMCNNNKIIYGNVVSFKYNDW